MSNWEEVTLDKLGDLVTGKQKKHSDPLLFKNGNVPFIDGKEVSESRLNILKCNRYYNKLGLEQSRIFPKNTVCLVRCGSSGDSALLKFSACLSDKIYGFNSFEKVSDPKFIKYCLTFKETKDKLISLANSSTAQPVLSFKKLSLLKFFVPKFQTQKNIGDILSVYDELIENCQRQIEILENLRKDLYKEWFINLRFPNYEKHSIKEGLPQGWKNLKIRDIVEIQNGKKPAGYANSNGQYPFFTCSSETQKSIGFSYDTSAILVSSGGNFVAKKYRGKFEAMTDVFILKVKNFEMEYLAFCSIKVELINLNKTIVGTTIKHLSKKNLGDINLIVPNNSDLKKFNIFCEDIQSKIEKLDAKMRKN